jgi:hypothetical protein
MIAQRSTVKYETANRVNAITSGRLFSYSLRTLHSVRIDERLAWKGSKPSSKAAMSRRGSIHANKVPTAMWAPLARLLIDKLAKAILSLQQGSDKIENFHVVDTRDTLKPPDIDEIGPTRHWLNEIHPSYERYLKVGRRIELQKLYKLLYQSDD